MSSYFKFKDSLPESLRSGVIYHFKCAKCNLSYVGCTWRFWETRLQEHLHISALTGKPLSGCQIFAPMQHARACQYHLKRDDFTIIGSEKNRYLLRVKETIFIYKLKPRINGPESSVKLHLFVWGRHLSGIFGMFVFCMYVRLLFDIDTFADDGDSGLMKYSNLVVNTLQYFLVKEWTL